MRASAQGIGPPLNAFFSEVDGEQRAGGDTLAPSDAVWVVVSGIDRCNEQGVHVRAAKTRHGWELPRKVDAPPDGAGGSARLPLEVYGADVETSSYPLPSSVTFAESPGSFDCPIMSVIFNANGV